MCNRDNYVALVNNVGTERYMSPEIISSSEYNNKTDIYFVVFYYMNYLRIKNIYQELIWNGFGVQKNKEIICNNMLCKNPEERYNALNIIKLINRLYP